MGGRRAQAPLVAGRVAPPPLKARAASSPRPAVPACQVRVYHITAAGWERVSEDDSMDLYFKFKGEIKA